jgi:drug/metabolite transporter (DMT)-like permease
VPEARRARFLLVLISLCWGLNWPATKIALDEVTPWTLRLVGYVVGALFLFLLVRMQKRDPALPVGAMRLHVVVSAVLTILAFGLFGSFAQLAGLTSRVVIVAYSMPVWASVLAVLLLGERLNARSLLGLVLAIGGLAVLIWPLAAHGVPLALLLALGSALSWAAGTIYLQWARLKGDVVVITAWQLVVCVVVTAVCVVLFEGVPHLWPLSPRVLLALTFHGLIGTATAYLLWFDVVGRVPTATASLGLLFVPVVGIIGSVLILGERPSAADAVGFTLMFAAAACVLLPTSSRSAP